MLIEAGYRCAMPRCGAETVEIHHIVDYATVKEHSFDNLIALCPTCHARATKGEIDRKAVLQIKANLSVLAGRYGDIEQRVLRALAEAPTIKAVQLPGGWDISVLYLLRDGLLVKAPSQGGVFSGGFTLSPETYLLTDKGRAFIQRWLASDPLP